LIKKAIKFSAWGFRGIHGPDASVIPTGTKRQKFGNSVNLAIPLFRQKIQWTLRLPGLD
jgi:hypothetical protein